MSFLKLPREIRDQIYESCIDDATYHGAEAPQKPPKTLDFFRFSLYDVLPISGVNSQIRQEMFQTVARLNSITFYIQTDEKKHEDQLQRIDRFLEHFEEGDRDRMLAKPIRIRLGEHDDARKACDPTTTGWHSTSRTACPQSGSLESFIKALGQWRTSARFSIEFRVSLARSWVPPPIHRTLLSTDVGEEAAEKLMEYRRFVREGVWKLWLECGAKELNIAQLMEGYEDLSTWQFRIQRLDFASSGWMSARYHLESRNLTTRELATLKNIARQSSKV